MMWYGAIVPNVKNGVGFISSICQRASTRSISVGERDDPLEGSLNDNLEGDWTNQIQSRQWDIWQIDSSASWSQLQGFLVVRRDDNRCVSQVRAEPRG